MKIKIQNYCLFDTNVYHKLEEIDNSLKWINDDNFQYVYNFFKNEYKRNKDISLKENIYRTFLNHYEQLEILDKDQKIIDQDFINIKIKYPYIIFDKQFNNVKLIRKYFYIENSSKYNLCPTNFVNKIAIPKLYLLKHKIKKLKENNKNREELKEYKNSLIYFQDYHNLFLINKYSKELYEKSKNLLEHLNDL